MTDTYNACPNCQGPVWDNRQRKAAGNLNPKAPDYACKDKESCAWVMWPAPSPSRSPTYQRAPTAATTANTTVTYPAAQQAQPTTATPTRQQVAQRREQVRAAYGDCVGWVLAVVVPDAQGVGVTVDVQAMAFSIFRATYGTAREFAFPPPRQQAAPIPPPPLRRPEPTPPTEADYPEALQDDDDDLPF